MKKITEGRYEISASRAVAIERFMQMQTVCREKLTDEMEIEFLCSKNGKIVITNPPTRSARRHISTELFAELSEQGEKTYVTYYTSFSKANNVLKSICIIIDMIIAVAAFIFAAIGDNKIYSVPLLILCIGFNIFFLVTASKEKENFPKDSQILIKELEKRVEAVNLWDK